jgi:hypothetical protein
MTRQVNKQSCLGAGKRIFAPPMHYVSSDPILFEPLFAVLFRLVLLLQAFLSYSTQTVHPLLQAFAECLELFT